MHLWTYKANHCLTFCKEFKRIQQVSIGHFITDSIQVYMDIIQMYSLLDRYIVLLLDTNKSISFQIK